MSSTSFNATVTIIGQYGCSYQYLATSFGHQLDKIRAIIASNEVADTCMYKQLMHTTSKFCAGP